MFKLLKHNKEIILYSICIAFLLLLLKLLQVQFLVFNYSLEIYLGISSLLFTVVGIFLNRQLNPPKTIVIERQVLPESTVNQKEISDRNISKRELEVLQLIANGLTNQQIGNQLFVSLNTIKTHSSNLYSKLGVKRRPEAIAKAKELKIIL